MLTKLTTFNFERNNVRIIDKDGNPWFVLSDICKILTIDHIKDTANRLEIDEVGQTEVIDRLGRTQKAYIINESGLYAVILRSDKPQAKPFRKWVTSEVLPTIRKTGTYMSNSVDDYKARTLAVKEQNAKIRTAQLMYKIADSTDTKYKQVLQARITQLLTGEYLLPLPQVDELTLSATEIGERLGITAHRVGMIANAHGLKTDKYGKYFYDKAKTADKQVETFRYYESSVEVFRRLLSERAAV